MGADALTLTTGGLHLGGGRLAICAPLTGATLDGLRAEAAKAIAAAPDLVELRADGFEAVANEESLMAALAMLNETLPGTPVLFTLRAAFENGLRDIPREAALRTYVQAMQSGYVQLIDTELANDAGFLGVVLQCARANGVRVILSHHNFDHTPGADAMLATLQAMQRAGADIAKIAVMPRSKADVQALYDAMTRFRADAAIPHIGIAMGALGAETRVLGAQYGSVLTYAALDEASGSAPGQLTVSAMRAALAGL